MILEWIDSRNRTLEKLDRIKVGMLASGQYERSDLFPDVFQRKSEISADDTAVLPEAGPDKKVSYELEAPTDFGENEYQRLMAEVAKHSSGSVSGDQVTTNGDGWI